MKALVVVDGGICGFQTRIQAESDDAQNVTFKIASACEKVRKFGEALQAKGRWMAMPRSARAPGALC